MICVEIWNKGGSSRGKHDIFTGTHKLKICILFRSCVFRLYWFDENLNSNTQTLGLVKDEEKNVVYFPLLCFHVHIQVNCTHCIPRYVYDVNITLHLFTSGALWVCSFITLISYWEQWIELAEFVLRISSKSSLRSEGSISQRDFKAFTFARGLTNIYLLCVEFISRLRCDWKAYTFNQTEKTNKREKNTSYL